MMATSMQYCRQIPDHAKKMDELQAKILTELSAQATDEAKAVLSREDVMKIII